MTRAEFLRRLRSGLAGLPRQTADELMADYQRHFEQAATEGRDEAETADQLGDPSRLARDIRADALLSSWEERPSFRGAFQAVAVLAGLGAADVVLLVPALVVAILILAIVALVGLTAFVAGVGLIAFGLAHGLAGGTFAALLGGIGLIASAVALGGAVILAGKYLIAGLVWYSRQHRRALNRSARTAGFNGIEA